MVKLLFQFLRLYAAIMLTLAFGALAIGVLVLLIIAHIANG